MTKRTRTITWGAMFVAMGILLPIIFHSTGLGRAMLPMHIPVLLSGFFVGPLMGAVVGALTPLLSTLFTGMPPLMPPIAQRMVFELATFGFVTGLLYRRLALGRRLGSLPGIYVSLVAAMIAGRLVYGVASYVMLPMFGLEAIPILYPLTLGLGASLPGVALQLVVIPPVVHLLTRHMRSTGAAPGG